MGKSFVFSIDLHHTLDNMESLDTIICISELLRLEDRGYFLCRSRASIFFGTRSTFDISRAFTKLVFCVLKPSWANHKRRKLCGGIIPCVSRIRIFQKAWHQRPKPPSDQMRSCQLSKRFVTFQGFLVGSKR